MYQFVRSFSSVESKCEVLFSSSHWLYYVYLPPLPNASGRSQSFLFKPYHHFKKLNVQSS